MKIVFDDGTTIDIILNDSVLKKSLVRCFKHLQHIDLPFRERDGAIFLQNTSVESEIAVLFEYAEKLSITLDKKKCVELDQQYFNFLHFLYEKNYDGRADWMDFHETIHTIECLTRGQARDRLKLDFRDLAGPLEEPFHRSWLDHGVTQVKAGQVYCIWQELSKNPWDYWTNQEPNDITRICELCKPWLTLRPTLHIALSDMDFVPVSQEKIKKFMAWWADYEKDWCRHWNLSSWSWQEMFKVLPVGHVDDLDSLILVNHNKARPSRVVLDTGPDFTESLHFEIGINAHWVSHAPTLEVSIDGAMIPTSDLRPGKNQLEFDVHLEHGDHTLQIKRTGSTNLDPTQTVTIENISADGIDCGQLILRNSHYRPVYPEPWATQQRANDVVLPKQIPYETVLGHDGTWTMDFPVPFYPYVLEINSKPLDIFENTV